MSSKESMIERVARSLFLDIVGKSIGQGYAEQLVDDCWKSYAPIARVAIKAMREPNESMKRQGFLANCKVQACSDYEENGKCCHCGQGFDHRDGCGHAAVASYQAMIDVALQEADSGTQ